MIKIREATYDDVPEITELFRETILSVNTEDYTTDQLEAWSSKHSDTNLWEDKIEEEYFIVAFERKKIIGFASLREDTYIDLLFVHKDHQHKGVAGKLLKHLENVSLEQEAIVLKCDASLTAFKFFEKKGFKKLKKNMIIINNEELYNYSMIKSL